MAKAIKTNVLRHLDALKIPYVMAVWTVEGKDANERLVSDREGFGRFETAEAELAGEEA